MTADNRLTVGILRTDSVMEELRPHFGDYPDMFGELLEEAARTLGENALELVGYDVQAGELPSRTDACHGYVITGSRHSVYDDLDWIRGLAEFLSSVLDADGRIVGICFGHQLMAHFFGGRTEPASDGWAVGVHETRLFAEEPWMQPSREAVSLLSMHKDQVTELPPGGRLIAGSEFCPVGGFVVGEQVMTLQSHPEFNKPYVEALIRRREELLGADTYRAGLRSLEQDTHEPLVDQWIMRFLGAGASLRKGQER